MRIIILTNDNFFSFSVLRDILCTRKEDIKLVVFSSALIGKRGSMASIRWSLAHTGLRHTVFKLMVYGVFKAMRIVCKVLAVLPNNYSSLLWTKRNHIDCIRAENINELMIISKIEQACPDLIVSVSMNQIVGKQILDMPPHRCINVHCAPLPRYGGMSPYVWVLANNDRASAATIHYMDEGLDTGDIIAQEMVEVVKRDSAFALFYRCCLQAGKMLVKVVDDIEAGRSSSYRQDLSQKTYFSWPTKDCVRNLRKNGFCLAKISDFVLAVFRQRPRV